MGVKALERDSKELFEQFLAFEAEQKLFELWIGSAPVWHPMRFQIYVALQRAKGTLSVEGTTKRASPTEVLRWTVLNPKFWRNILLANPWQLPQSDLLVINHPRRVLEQGRYWCKYTDLLLRKTRIGYSVIEPFDQWQHYYPPETDGLHYADAMMLVNGVAKRLVRWIAPPHQANLERLRQIVEAVNRHFSVKLDVRRWSEVFWKTVQAVGVERKTCKTIMQRVRPRALLLTSYYGNYHWLLAAKDLGVPVVEVQHGTIENHIAYQYHPDVHTELVPDYLLMFGEFWKEQVHMPVPADHLIPVGFPYLERHARQGSKSEKQTILFVSQAPVGPDLARVAVDLHALVDPQQYEVVYKLHPWELEFCQDTYLKELQQHGIRICGPKDDLYSLFAEASFQVGVYSTALYEGLAFGLRTFVVALYNHSAMERLYDGGHATLVNDGAAIARAIDEGTDVEVDQGRLWARNGVANMDRALQQIITS